MYEAIRQALTAYALRPKPFIKSSSEDDKPTVNKSSRVLTFLLASAAFDEDVDNGTRENLLANSVVISHHPTICVSGHNLTLLIVC